MIEILQKRFKRFNKNMICREFKYEIDKEYEEKSTSLWMWFSCVCEYPLDLFKYYVPNQSNFCEVEQFDEILKEEHYSKLHSLKLKLKQKLV